jgi:hypothetical protein
MLSKFPNSTLKLGAPVSLSPQSEFAGRANNPTGVRGEVILLDTGSDNDGGWVRVRWSSRFTNDYRKKDYDLIVEGEPGFLED